MKTSTVFRLVLLFLAGSASAGEDTIYLEETVISGNQELPRVLYILPWREMTTESLPIRTLQLDEPSVLVPVYPADFRRELAYRQQLKLLKQAQAQTEPDKEVNPIQKTEGK